MMELIRWLYMHNALNIGNNDVIVQEELRFLVIKEETAEKGGQWNSTITYFDVREQQQKVAHFRLCGSPDRR